MSFQMHEKCKCTNLCGGSEIIGNQEIQLEKLQWFEKGATFHYFHSHLYIYIIPNNKPKKKKEPAVI